MRSVSLALVVSCLSGATKAGVMPVSKDECAAWRSHLIPLPHEIAIARKAIVQPRDVGIALRAGGEIEQQALKEVKTMFEAQSGVAAAGDRFEIRIGVVDEQTCLGGVAVPAAERLKTLPHRDQAYVIQR